MSARTLVFMTLAAVLGLFSPACKSRPQATETHTWVLDAPAYNADRMTKLGAEIQAFLKQRKTEVVVVASDDLLRLTFPDPPQVRWIPTLVNHYAGDLDNAECPGPPIPGSACLKRAPESIDRVKNQEISRVAVAMTQTLHGLGVAKPQVVMKDDRIVVVTSASDRQRMQQQVSALEAMRLPFWRRSYD